ncbi:Integrase core domain-containing protein [Microbacterium saccharophilum]|uniref:Integrase core domain-containing protein n=1 Tax=Microbacterium saccharophilum TaxID=1213358 RepID=A0A7Z7GG45_9MICO|nr:Integrase core domain-containing protein [Microbacterium saccharophilum]
MACRFLNVSTSGYYEWVSRPPSPRAVADATLTTTIRRIHADSRETYGAPRVLAELRLGLGVHVGRKRVARLMRLDGLVGVSHRRKRRGWKPDTATHEDLVKRQFRADAPNRLWFCDITQHRARDGWVYCAAVIDAYSRRIVGWSISDRITAEIVVDALEMARWRRRPEPGTVVHADRGAQGGFNWSSQHLESEVFGWFDDNSRQIERCGQGFGLRARLRSRERCSIGSGSRLRRGCCRKKLRRGSGCRSRSVAGGSTTLAACRRSI